MLGDTGGPETHPSWDGSCPPAPGVLSQGRSRPVLAFRGNGIDYMEFRLWIGLHSAFQCLILVATDASFIIKYITRFTEEGFSTLISFIFIYDAIKKMIGAFKYYPINSDFKPDYVTMYKCECVAPDPGECTSLPVPDGGGGGVPVWINPPGSSAWGGETSSSSSSGSGFGQDGSKALFPVDEHVGAGEAEPHLEQPDLDG